MAWHQTIITLDPKPRGFHLVTGDVLSQLTVLSDYRIGLLHLFIQHTSASLAVNENADPDVRGDLERHFNVMVPENAPHYEHTMEGPDDMPAHIKSVLIGPSLTLPIRDGRPVLGTWQGIYLCEHRDHGGARRIVATLQGE
ncbi:YjbQ family protein [Marinobacter halodurans]|uniref:YjbQ family protein n=1 Tax=Marinobacter halodurans TaxID=2528979 RepID=A0ABY1ZSH7_9GAMM|nr:secondary thiamine-phosphate synthase enzyme YjbQ [Marinobacter halodurans]TBW57951.1 YjbQ family protein [Marinobacter halodurans]